MAWRFLKFCATASFVATLLTGSFARGASGTATAAPIVLTGADRRPAMSLDGDWATIVDPYFSGLFSFHHEEKKNGWFRNYKAKPDDPFPTEYDFGKAAKLTVPGDWNTQRESLMYYEGPVWYEKDFSYDPKPKTHIFLHVGAANYKSWFWVNGEKVCEHEGGFTSFNCEVTQALHAGGNFVVAAADNTRHEDNVPTLETDWWNYGGLTRDVSLIEVPERFIDQYDLHLSRDEDGVIEGWVHVVGAAQGTSVEVQIPELHARASAEIGAEGRTALHFSVKGLERWSPETPKLYKIVLRAGEDSVDELIGFRTIEVHGTDILLNAKPVFLRGVCIHAEAPYRTGRAYSNKDAETLLGWVKELGGNFARLAHYPHAETMLRAADRMGVMLWSENPVYWAVQFDNPKVLAKAEQQLDEEINTSRNHAAIILWSMANETPNTPARTQFISTLASRARSLDSTRLITAALLVRGQGNTKIVDDPLGNVLDVIGTNEYIGWYEGRPDKADTTQWQIAYEKPLIMSEFGGEAKAGLHGSDKERWTEEYQADIYRHQLPMLNRIAQLRGMSPWILMDFRSPNRPLAGIQDEFNRKGLISEQGKKKQAFYVLQKAYKERTVGNPK
ncbi:glycoside hydrolase family 2 protein [Occallatibacter savannae]|uniref:glycoside hydrolase family 2 protein n=1 Tax=Occallatibacter savannae TaxID=1002691 RepID=UPI000D690F0C|nr:glycoside hydrolase family 2 TIM barrel-domain containing protein [Occallatibacter savannae]